MPVALLIALLASVPVPATTLAPWTELVERLSLGQQSAAPRARVEPFLGRIQLSGLSGRPVVLKSALCPKVLPGAEGPTLVCETRRVWIEVQKDSAGWMLEIRRLRGLPFATLEDSTLVAFTLSSLSMDEECPGRSPAARGECALARGGLDEARAFFEKAVSDPMGHSIAALRLGDLAMLHGAPGEALERYQAVGRQSVLYRLAASRICELSGRCLAESEAKKAFDRMGLPEAMALDLSLRRIRLDAYEGRDAGVLDGLGATPDGCARYSPLCQRLLLSALRPDPAGAAALESYLDAPFRDEPPLRIPLAQAAASVAEARGVPRVAAMILSATTPAVPPSDLPAHLLRTIELYRAAGDRVRAAAVLEFAVSRLSRLQRGGARWTAITRALRAEAMSANALQAAELAEETARTTKDTLARASAVVEAAASLENPR